MTFHSVCPHCNTVAQWRFRIKKRDIFRCPGCGIEFVGNIATVKVKKTIKNYQSVYATEYAREEFSYRPYFHKLLSFLPKRAVGSILIDIGCCQGFVLQIAQDCGFRVMGVDASPAMVKIARDRGFTVYQEIFERLSLPARKFTVVTLLQTLEHVKNLDEVLEKIYRLLQPGGYLIVTTPDREGFLGKLMGKYWFTYYNHEHLYFFSKLAIKNLLIKHKYHICRLFTENGRILTIRYIFSRLLYSYYTQNRPLYWVLYLWRLILFPFWLVPIFEPKVNIVVVAQKPRYRV